MNTPNKLTVLRVCLIPVFLAFVYIDFPLHFLAALLVFAFASFTDWLDGYLARRDNLVTNFGKLMDPLADKLLVTAAFMAFIEIGITSAIPVFIIIAREFLVTSIRMIALESGKVIAANIWGKLKTVIQMVSIIAILLLLHLGLSWTPLVAEILVWASAIITLISGAVYVAQNKELLAQ